MQTGLSPSLSVVIVALADTPNSLAEPAGLAGVLDALAQQQQPPPMEIIVPHDSGVKGMEELKSTFPGVRFIPVDDAGPVCSPQRLDRLRAQGVGVAVGEIIAVIEDHVRPNERWAMCIVEAHRQPFAAVGGAVENGVRRMVNWAAYFCDLGRYQNPLPPGESPFASVVNVSYKRSALHSIRGVWQEKFDEPTVHAALRSSGHKLALSPAIVVTQHRHGLRLGTALRQFFAWGRSYAEIRSHRAAAIRRAALACMTATLPAVMLARLMMGVLRKRRNVGAFLAALPITALLAVSWSCGEMRGYIHPSQQDR